MSAAREHYALFHKADVEGTGNDVVLQPGVMRPLFRVPLIVEHHQFLILLENRP